MNDLRDAPNVHVMPAGALRTVPMPELRTADARTLDAARRGLDCRTSDDKLRAELVRLVDCLQALRLEVDLLKEHVARLDAQARPLAMAEDAWGVG